MLLLSRGCAIAASGVWPPSMSFDAFFSAERSWYGPNNGMFLTLIRRQEVVHPWPREEISALAVLSLRVCRFRGESSVPRARTSNDMASSLSTRDTVLTPTLSCIACTARSDHVDVSELDTLAAIAADCFGSRVMHACSTWASQEHLKMLLSM